MTKSEALEKLDNMIKYTPFCKDGCKEALIMARDALAMSKPKEPNQAEPVQWYEVMSR